MLRTGTLTRLVSAALLIFGAAFVPPAFADPASPFTITNVDSPDPVTSGAELLYTITMTNTGGSKATEVMMTDQFNFLGGIGVPPQLQVTSTRGSCTQTATYIQCTAGTVEGGGTWVVTIRGIVTASAGTAINNTATVTGTRSAQNFTSTAAASTLVSGGSASAVDLSISKNGPASVQVSSPMTYTLTVYNNGTLNATNVKVSDTVPAGLTGITAAGTSLFVCSVSGQTVTCDGGAVNAGANATITINATASAVVGTITNTASVDPDNTIAESNELNNTSALVDTQVLSSIPSTPLTVNMTDDPAQLAGAGPDPVVPGQTLTFKALVTNTTTLRADDVVVVIGTQGLEAASIQAVQVVTDGTVGNGNGCFVTAPEARCSIRTLNGGGTLLVTVSGQVIASAGSTLITTASVTGNIKNTGTSASDIEKTTVKPSVDLTVTKSDSPDPVCARSWPTNTPPASPPLLGPAVCLGGLTYTFVVGNSGINPASNVVLRDPLPPGTVLDSFTAPAFSGGCSVGGSNVLTCTAGTIGPETTTTVTIVLVAPPSTGTITNTVTVDPANAIFEADETNNSASQSTAVSTGIDLALTKTDVAPGCDPIATAGTQVYTITVDNLGPQNAQNVRVRDTLPANTIFRDAVADNGFTCSHSNGVVECVGGSILGTTAEFYAPFGAPGNDTATIVIRVFAQPTVGSMHNEVRVDPLGEIAEVNEDNNIAFQDTSVESGGAAKCAFNQLTIDKTQISPLNDVARNAKVKYEIKVGNEGTDPAVHVTVRDFLPAGSRYMEATGSNEFLCKEFAAYIECSGGQIPAGGTATITLYMFAPDTPGAYTNQAIVDPDNTIAEGNEFDNADSVETKVKNGGNGPFIDLQIVKADTAASIPGAGPDPVRPKGTLTYKIKVYNVGSDSASDVMVRDVLPAGVTFVSAGDESPGNPGSFTCNHSNGTVDCTGGTIDPGGPAVNRIITVVVQAPNYQTSLTNQAFADPNNAIPEGDEQNNTSSVQTTVASVINLTIHKDGPDHSTQSQVDSYTIKVKNEAPSADATQGENALGVVMHDPLPIGLIPLSVNAGTGNNFACTVSENPINVVDCVGDLAPEQEVTITIEVFMTAENNRSLDNEACVDPANLIAESDEFDNCWTKSTVVGPEPKHHPDLKVTKTASTANVTPDTDLTYTITVENVGDANAFGTVIVTDPDPAQTSFVSASGTGWSCSNASGTTTCTLAAGLAQGATSDPITLVVHVNVGATSSITNTAVADTAQSDPSDTTAEPEVVVDNNSATVVVSVGQAGFDLAIASVVDTPDPAIRGQALAYTVVGVNTGATTANNVKINVTIPTSGVTFMGAAGSNGFNCGEPASGVVTCTGNLAGGGSTTITANFLVNLAAAADLTLSATIDPDNAFTEPNEANNTDSETTTISGSGCDFFCVDLVSVSLNDDPDPVAKDATVTYTYKVVNIGALSTAAANGTAELAFFDLYGDVSSAVPTSSSSSWTCSTFSFVAGAHLESNCTGELGPGEEVTFTLTVTAKAAGTITARGLADPDNTLTEFNDFTPPPPASPTAFGNNLIFQTTTVNP